MVPDPDLDLVSAVFGGAGVRDVTRSLSCAIGVGNSLILSSGGGGCIYGSVVSSGYLLRAPVFSSCFSGY